jgi:protoporphyrinogen oxidase
MPEGAKKRALIIGAGPAGLTAALEFQRKTGIQPIVIEQLDIAGGLARTVNYKGNRIDIGGHRFFSKSDRVMQWWLEILPIDPTVRDEVTLTYHNTTSTYSFEEKAPEHPDKIMLVRNRKSRIYFLRKFFNYPITLNKETIQHLGVFRIFKIGVSYLSTKIFPLKTINNLEEFFISRFGKELYLTFFKSYTEKVWGIACKNISAEWGAQRIKGLSITQTIKHFLTSGTKKSGNDVSQKSTETSLIEKFLYPKFGPGQMWETVAEMIEKSNGVIKYNHTCENIVTENELIKGAFIRNKLTGEEEFISCDFFFSTMPVKELISKLKANIPEEVKTVSEGLVYRDFITVGLLVQELEIRDEKDGKKIPVKDNWFYIQEPEVMVGRLQVFNNWSPFMVAKPEQTTWIGLEYFCNTEDDIWHMSDEDLFKFASAELEQIGIIKKDKVLDFTIIRQEKTYPAYFGTYNQFDVVRSFTENFSNLYLIGRNGMHKYNNQDHSMLTAIEAVETIIAGTTDKSTLWAINTEEDYHEEKKA